jgi:hypothetical protein
LLLAVPENIFYEAEHDLIELSAEVCLQRRGRAIRLVVSRDEPGCVQSQDNLRLVHIVAQAHQWLEQLLSGEVSSLRIIADSAGKSEGYVSRVVRAAFLAPDLLEAMLEGRAPAQLTLAQLTKDLPWDWNEQRRRFAGVLGAKRSSRQPELTAV